MKSKFNNGMNRHSNKGIHRTYIMYQQHLDKLMELKLKHNMTFSEILRRLVEGYGDRLSSSLIQNFYK